MTRYMLPARVHVLVVIAFCCVASARADDVPADSAIAKVIRQSRWVAFSPTRFNPEARPPTIPSDDSIRADLQVLRRAGFDAIITYGAEVQAVVTLAEQEGFSAVLLGVWDPSSQQEFALAAAAAESSLVKGIIVGNE